jgi:hypothetical protein
MNPTPVSRRIDLVLALIPYPGCHASCSPGVGPTSAIDQTSSSVSRLGRRLSAAALSALPL